MSLALAQPVQTLKLAEIEDKAKRALMSLCVDAEGRPATVEEVAVFAQFCAKKGLDPFSKQVYFIKDKRGKVSYQISIDGLRGRAQATGLYRGQLGPFWMGKDKLWQEYWVEDGHPLAAKVGILREGWDQPCWGFARYRSFAGVVNDYTPWGKSPDNQLAKCAEAQALRKAFPEACGHMYTPDEMASYDHPEHFQGEIVSETVTKSKPKKSYPTVDVTAGAGPAQAPAPAKSVVDRVLEAEEVEEADYSIATEEEIAASQEAFDAVLNQAEEITAKAARQPASSETLETTWAMWRELYPEGTIDKVREAFPGVSMRDATTAQCKEMQAHLKPLLERKAAF